ncbi:hypothetical protein ACF09J_11735 [Streptomyces sp. NPDC014889]|uniref:hypothetical protein n=1 Tax=Streptomyces sp. NPDC014889 TaxID=3364928 RepID=UPI0036F9B10F
MTAYWGHGGPYETWVEFLRRWAAEEAVHPGTLPALAQEHFPGETWERLVLHLGAALDTRLRAWAERLVQAMLAAPDEFSAGRALAQARTELQAVRALAGHPGLPESTRTRMAEVVDAQITDLQDQLERNLDRLAAQGSDPRWVDQRRRTLRDNPLTVLLAARPPASGADAPTGAAPVADPWAHAPATRPRRRVITD